MNAYNSENLYHVFENSRARDPCSNEIFFLSDPDAPELPPPLELDSQDTDTAPPVYQDINELSCKPIKVVDCDESEQQCQHREHNLVIDTCKPFVSPNP